MNKNNTCRCNNCGTYFIFDHNDEENIRIFHINKPQQFAICSAKCKYEAADQMAEFLTKYLGMGEDELHYTMLQLLYPNEEQYLDDYIKFLESHAEEYGLFLEDGNAELFKHIWKQQYYANYN